MNCKELTKTFMMILAKKHLLVFKKIIQRFKGDLKMIMIRAVRDLPAKRAVSQVLYLRF